MTNWVYKKRLTDHFTLEIFIGEIRKETNAK